MTQKTNSLTLHIWSYLALFVSLILIFLWLFQVLFFQSYYEFKTTQTLEKIANETKNNYKNDGENLNLDLLSYDNNACIEIVKNNVSVYTSDNRRGCLFIEKGNREDNYINDFINGENAERTYKIVNPALKNQTLIKAVKLDDVTYAFINVSLEPTDPAIRIIREELIYITVVIYILSFLFAIFISKKISTPILKINKHAKQMAKGDLDTPFDLDEKIKEINELNETLNNTQKELSKLNETRRDLLANVTHDLKTPLTMIKAYAEMARDLNKNNTGKREDNLNIIIEESNRLNLLVNDILDLSKSESDMYTLNKEEFELNSFIESIIHRFDYLKEEGYKIKFDSKDKYIIIADKQKLEQVIYNLIINAVNYTGRNKTVTVKIEDYKKHIRVSILDTGKGIGKEEIDKIWDKYYKNEKNHKRNKIGTGLGLSIVKNILIKHNFNFGVESEVGKGTKFYFDIDK